MTHQKDLYKNTSSQLLPPHFFLNEIQARKTAKEASGLPADGWLSITREDSHCRTNTSQLRVRKPLETYMCQGVLTSRGVVRTVRNSAPLPHTPEYSG